MLVKVQVALVSLAVVIALLAGVYALAWRHAATAAQLSQQEALRTAQIVVQKAESIRLSIQAERDRLAQQLEDAANAAPVVHPACLGVDRVRRLNQLR